MLRRGLVAGLCLVACASGASTTSPAPTVSDVSPPGASFRTSTQVTISGANLSRDDKVAFGPLVATVLGATGDALHVEVPAAKKPRRVQVTVSNAAGGATWSSTFVFRGMAPEDLRFVDRGALPSTASRVAAGDVDGDGKTDLVLATDEHLALLAGDGKLGFSAKADVAQANAAMVLASLGGKGETIVVGGAALGLVKFADGALVATPLDGSPAVVALATARLGSGADDVYAVTQGDSGYALSKLHPGEHPTLSPVFDLGSFVPVSLALADANGDGTVDALVGGAAGGPRLLLGDGHGAFADAPAGTFPSSVAGPARFSDLDADGRLDVVVAASAGDRAFKNAGQIFFDRTTQLFGRDDARAAFEADLDADAAIDRVGGDGLAVLRNDGSGRFFDYTVQATPAALRHATPLLAADLDGDDDPELVVRTADGALHLLENWAPRSYVDSDGDGVPDAIDNCPADANADQANRDANHFSCVAADCATEPGCRLLVTDPSAYLACGGPLSFADAQAFCGARGTHLALPTNADEATALANLLGTSGWIDLTDAAQEGHFVRTDGSDPTWTNWAATQPDNAGGVENCVEILSNGTWNDLPCDQKIAFACEEAPARAGDSKGDACDDCPMLPDDDQADACGAAP